MDLTPGWYIVKRGVDTPCEIVEVSAASPIVAAFDPTTTSANDRRWGPFTSLQEAIAKRVGLIRAGQCLPR